MNKFLIVLVASVSLSACAKVKFVKIQGDPGENCSVVEALNGAEVTCGDSTIFIPSGTTGLDGIPGQDGVDGQDGANGTNGSNGQNGSSCTVTSVPEGALITCTDGSSALVKNGTDGNDGNNGSGNDDDKCKDSDDDKNCGKGND